jgi:methylated-thiol--corrinoid protein
MAQHIDIIMEQVLEIKNKDPARYERLIQEGMLTELGFDVLAKGPKVLTIDEVKAKHKPKDANYAAMADAVITGNSAKVKELVEAAIAKGKDPVDLVTNALMPGIQTQCELYDLGKAFVPEILLSNAAMLTGIKICQAKLGNIPKKGKIATFVVEGDLHDIGKNIVSAIYRANGFEVIDLGRDVSVEKVVETAKTEKLQMASGSTLMSTTKGSLKRIAETLTEENLKVPIACGGAAVSRAFVETFDNSIYGKSPVDAVNIASAICNGKGWKEARTIKH